MRKSTFFLPLALFSCAGGATPDPIRMAENLKDFREIRDSGIPPVARIIARNRIASEQGASTAQLAAENGLPLAQLVMETYVGQASRPTAGK